MIAAGDRADGDEQDSLSGEEDFGNEHDDDDVDDDGDGQNGGQGGGQDGGVKDEKKDDDDDKQHDSRHDDDSSSSSDGNSSHFRIAMNDVPKSTPKNKRGNLLEQRPYSFRDVEDSIESFGAEDGQDIKDWMLQFETMSKTANWSDKQKMIMCRKKMTGTARRFVFAQRDLTSFPKLKSALIKEFAPFVRASDIHRKLAARKKNRRKAREITYTKCSASLWQLTLTKRAFATQSISQLKEKLLNFEKVQMKSTKKSRTDDVCPKRKEQRKPDPKKESEKADTKRHCYNCGEPSHVATECPQKNDGPKCFNCNAFGHLSKECTKKKEKKPAKVNVLESVNSAKPSLQIKGKDVEISGMIDTGSEVSLIRKDLWSRLAVNGARLQKSNMKVRGYGGGVNVVIGEILLNVFVENEEHTICFYVVPCEAIDILMLIGMDFLGKVDYAITPEGVRVRKFAAKECESDQSDTKWVCRIGDCISDDDITVPPRYREQVLELIENYKPETSVRPVNELRINLTDNEVVCENPRRLAGLEKEVVKKQIGEWLDEGIIQPSTSEYASPIVVVPKKDGTRRVCIDYREINKKVVRDKFPTPNVEEQIDQLSEARVYTTLDLKNSYFHVAIEESSRKYTSFVTNDGQYEFLRAPFGLCTSGNAFGRLISAVLKDLVKDGKVIAFVDDVIIPSKNEQEGLEVLKIVLKVAEEAGLHFNWKKCAFLQRRVEYLGYTIYDGCIEPAPAKVEKMKQFPQPATVKELQRFYGLASYFRKFIPAFASIARPLSGMLKKESCFDFDADAVAAFNRIKGMLSSYPVLRIFCPGGETEVHTDASKVALAGILMQRAEDDGQFHPCYYYSRLTSGAEKNYHSYELETLAVVESLKKFQCYLLGYKFKIVTDCRAFKDTMMKRKMNARVARWVVDLAEFEYEIEHRSGEKMRHVDALSRADVLVVSASVTAQVRSAQADDDRVKSIIAEMGQTDSSKGFSICNGVLYEGDGEARRLYVPESIEVTIIRNAHEKGHFGVKKTKDRIESEYFIPDVEDKIKRCIATCVPCIVGERKRGKPEGELHPIPKGDVPLDTLHVDHLGPMPSTRKSYNYILTVVDGFTKFVWLFPVKTTTAEETVKKLRIISDTFGNPRRMICDRGAAFTSKLFTKYCDDEDIDLHLIVTGVPRGNGQVERVHRIIIPMLTKLSLEKPEEWYKYVAQVQRCLNSSWQRAIQTTPFQLLTGVKMRTREDEILYEMLQREIQEDFVNDRDELRKAAHSNIQKIQEENRKTYNLRRKPAQSFKKGDIVAIPKTQFGVGQKVKPKFFGPYEIVNVLPNDRYEVVKLDEDSEGPRMTSTAGDCVKPWSLPSRK